MTKAKLVVPNGFVKIEGLCPHCEEAGDESLLVQAPGGASCLNCGKTVQGKDIVKEKKAKK